MDTIEITTPDGAYMIKKQFVDEIYKMSKSRFRLFSKRLEITNELLVAMAINEDMIIRRRDL